MNSFSSYSFLLYIYTYIFSIYILYTFPCNSDKEYFLLCRHLESPVITLYVCFFYGLKNFMAYKNQHNMYK